MDDVAFLLPDHHDNVTAASILRLAQRFPSALPQEVHDALEEETLDYMLAPPSTLPPVICEEGKPIKSEELCAYWQQIGSMTTLADWQRAYLLYPCQMLKLNEYSA